MVKLDRPKKVTLPNGTTFHAKYKILKRDSLPADANIRRAFKRQRKQKEQGQRDKGVGSVFKKGFSLIKRALTSKTRTQALKYIGKKAIKYESEL